MGLRNVRNARNARYRRIHYNPPGFRHWNNTELHSGAGVYWIYNNDESLTHVTGSTVQCHYVWTGDGTTNWEGIVRRGVDPLPGETGIRAKVTIGFSITGMTAGNFRWYVQQTATSFYSANGHYTVTLDLTGKAATEYYAFHAIPHTDFDGTISLPIIHNMERTG